MKIVLSSRNKAKILAAKKVFSEVYENFDLETVEVHSGVSNTPMTDEEGIQGCLNRIEEAKKLASAGDIYVGLEGIITKNKFGVFLTGWAVIEMIKDHRIGMGCSAKVQIPDFIAKNVEDFKELSEVVRSHYASDLVDNMDELGSNGIITQQMYTRTDEFEHALKCALGYVFNETNFSQ